ncbi:MAG: hypothetical protein EYC70_16030 [Planctomycetota bacterium]|nr:MAG: hypothetical protein EYC70_16030 [Planctomycetota bacterium]
MSLLGGLLVALSAWLGGRALLPSRSVLSRDAWEEQAVAYLAGAAALLVAAMALTCAGLPLRAPLVWGLLAAAALPGAWRVVRDFRGAERCAACALSGWQKALLAVLGAGSVLVTLSLPLNEFDPILHFALKAKVLFYGGDILDPAFTGMVGPDGGPARVGRLMTHPNYPLGVPFLQAFAAHAGGRWDERWVQVPLAFWALCLPAAVSFGLRAFGPGAQRWGALLAAATPALYARNFLQDLLLGRGGEPVLAGLRGSTSLGSADLALAALLAGGCALLLRVRRQPCRRAAVAGGLCLAGMVLMKNEGLGLLAVLIAALALAALLQRFRAWKPAALVLATALLASAPWLVHRSRLPAIDENYTQQLAPGNILAQLGAREPLEKTREGLTGELDDASLANPPSRPATLLRVYFLEFLDVTTWGVLWLLFALCLPFRRGDPESRWLALFVLGGLALYALVLLVTPWALDQLSETGIPDRLFLHVLAPVAMVAALALERSRRGPATACVSAPRSV